MSKSAKSNDEKLITLTTLVLLQSQARRHKTVQDLAFMMVNESFKLVPYRQCVFWVRSGEGSITIQTVSGLGDLGETSPYLGWLEGIIRKKAMGLEVFESITAATLESDEDRKDWAEWCGAEALLIPFKDHDGTITGGLWIDREQPFSDSEKRILLELSEAYAHALDGLTRSDDPLLTRIKGALEPTRRRMIIAAILTAIALFPVRISVTVPAEVVARDPFVISSPMTGVIKDIPAGANTSVEEGALLVKLEDTTLKNEAEIAAKALAVAQASHARATREAFKDPQSKADVALLKADMEAKAAEFSYAKEVLDLSEIKATRSGIALFTDKNSLRGRPVQAGERIMLLADPADTEVMVRIPADRILNIRNDIEGRLFLNVSPLNNLSLRIISVSYEPTTDSDGLLTYKVRAAFADETDKPRVGLKGTAKIYGNRTVFIYKILRRPLAALRRIIGV